MRQVKSRICGRLWKIPLFFVDVPGLSPGYFPLERQEIEVRCRRGSAGSVPAW